MNINALNTEFESCFIFQAGTKSQREISEYRTQNILMLVSADESIHLKEKNFDVDILRTNNQRLLFSSNAELVSSCIFNKLRH